MSRVINRVGETWMTKEGYKALIIDCLDNSTCTIKLDDHRETVLYKKQYVHIKSGNIKNPYHPSVFGVGYKGEGRHKTKVNGKMTKMYYTYVDMIRRSYRSEELGKDPSYIDVYVCEEWHNFQNFGEWFEISYREGFELDKDILVKGNKVYSPETCRFVPKVINNLFISGSRGQYPRGVYRQGKKFKTKISINGNNNIRLGIFDTIEEAFQAYKVDKEKHVKQIAEEWKDRIDLEVYEAMYKWEILITD